MPLTTVALKAMYPYVFAHVREKGRAYTRDALMEASIAHEDGAPFDVIERFDFEHNAPGLHVETRMRAATEEAEGNAFCLFYKDGRLRRVWWRIGIVRTDAFLRLQTYAEQYAQQAHAITGRR